MGIFSLSKNPDPEPPHSTQQRTKNSLFNRHSSSTSHSSISSSSNSSSSSKLSHSPSTTNNKKSSGLLLSRFVGGRHDDTDPSIIAARERVMGAETAELEADRALEAARRQVREAKVHVKRLEREAAEEARRARVKQSQAAEVSKRGRGLGRHG